MKLEFWPQIFGNTQISNFIQIRLERAEIFPCGRSDKYLKQIPYKFDMLLATSDTHVSNLDHMLCRWGGDDIRTIIQQIRGSQSTEENMWTAQEERNNI